MIFQKNHVVAWPLAIFIGSITAIAAFAGGYFSHLFSGYSLKIIFACLLAIAGAMIKRILSVTLFNLVFISFAGCALVHPTDPYAVSVSEQSKTSFLSKSDSSGLPDIPVTLKEAISIALENNPQVAAARH